MIKKVLIKLGFYMGLIINPVIMAIIFFIILTPFGLIARSVGRDELKLTLTSEKSYWIKRKMLFNKQFFKKQF